MSSEEFHKLFTAFGILAVVICGDVPLDNRSARALNIAHLIESLCAMAEQTGTKLRKTHAVIKLLDGCSSELQSTGSASISFDRATLLEMYEQPAVQKLRDDQNEFYRATPESLIAKIVIRLAADLIDREGCAMSNAAMNNPLHGFSEATFISEIAKSLSLAREVFDLLGRARAALQFCSEEDRLSFATELEVEGTLRRFEELRIPAYLGVRNE